MYRRIAVVACVLALSACSSATEKRTIDIASAEPSATATSSATPDSLLDYVPDKPAEPKQEFTKASAIAFADYYFKVVFYAYGQDDAAPLKAISDPGCRGCAKALTNLENQNASGFVVIGEGAPTLEGSKVIAVDGTIANVSTTLTYPRVTVINSETGEQSGDWTKGASGKTTIGLSWDDKDGWTVLDFRDIY